MSSSEDYLDNLLQSVSDETVREEENMETPEKIEEVPDSSLPETKAASLYDDSEGSDDMEFPELAKLFEENETDGSEAQKEPEEEIAPDSIAVPEEGADGAGQTPDLAENESAEQEADLPEDASGGQDTDLPEEADVTELIDTLDADDDLAEISELLKKSDGQEKTDGDDEVAPEKADDTEPEPADTAKVQEAADSESAAPQKKTRKEKKKKDPSEKGKGLFGRILAFFTDDGDPGEDPEEKEQLDLSQENIAILEKVDKEKGKPAKKEKKPKPKKEKKPKPKKEKKPKPKKEKKPKPKKEKKPKAPKEPEKPLKPIGKKRIAVTIFFALTVFGMIMLFTFYIPGIMERQAGREAFRKGDYETVYDLFAAKKVKGNDEAMLKGAMLCLEMDRKLESYANYQKLEGMELERLHALISGVDKYQKIREKAAEYGVADYVNNSYLNLLGVLQSEYGVSEAEAQEITMLTDNIAYTKELKRILGQYPDLAEEIEEAVPAAPQEHVEEPADEMNMPDMPELPEEGAVEEPDQQQTEEEMDPAQPEIEEDVVDPEEE